MIRDGGHHGAVAGAVVGVEVFGCGFERTLEHDGRAVAERVGAGSVGVNPGDLDRQRTEKRAGDAHGVDRGAEVMAEARKSDSCRRACPANVVIALEDSRLQARPG